MKNFFLSFAVLVVPFSMTLGCSGGSDPTVITADEEFLAEEEARMEAYAEEMAAEAAAEPRNGN